MKRPQEKTALDVEDPDGKSRRSKVWDVSLK
jgi:hypothetical protein